MRIVDLANCESLTFAKPKVCTLFYSRVYSPQKLHKAWKLIDYRLQKQTLRVCEIESLHNRLNFSQECTLEIKAWKVKD